MEKVHNAGEISTELQNSFVKDLYLARCKDYEGNLFFSPFSIHVAMAMVYIGAKRDTESQIRKVLHFPQDKDLLLKNLKDLMLDLFKANEEYTLHTSNSAYVSDKLEIFEEYLAILKDYLQAEAKLVNFGAAEAVRQEINSDVEKATNTLIKDLIPQGALNPLTRMVLVNAIYFKGLWEHPFPSRRTNQSPFWVTKDSSEPLTLMSLEENVQYAILDELNATMITLNYKGNRLHMGVILPDQRDGLGAVEGKLENVRFSELEKKLSRQKVLVSLPKFKLEESIELVETFQQRGLLDLFDVKKCDLSGIDKKNNIYVSDIFHKAFIEVNEEGTEAAAATGVVMMARCFTKVPRFVADHPFLFYIRDRTSGQILFIGRFKTPPQSQTKAPAKEDL